MSRKGLGYSEMVELKNLWARSNETQKAHIVKEGKKTHPSPQETNPIQKEQSKVKINEITEDLHTKT